MKNQKTQSKLLIAMSAVILLLVALSATLTFAWFTASQNSTQNQNLEFGKLVLNGTGTGITATGTSGAKVIPGSTLGISGSATISSNIDYFVRANFVVQIKNQNNLDISTKAPAVSLPTAATIEGVANADTEAASYRGIIMNELFASNASANEVLKDYFADTNWLAATGSTDGFKYYKTKKLAADDALLVFDFSTEANALLEQADYGNAWQGLKLVVTLTIQAIQADHLLTSANAEITFTDTTDIASNVLTQAGVDKLATAIAWASATDANNVENPVAVPDAQQDPAP